MPFIDMPRTRSPKATMRAAAVGALLGVLFGSSPLDAQFAFTSAGPYPWLGTFASDLHADDFNNDGSVDLVVEAGADLVFLAGDGLGAFGPAVTSSTGTPGFSSVGFGDLDGDGNLDVAATDYSNDVVQLLLGDGAGTFTPWTTISLSGPTAVSIHDVNFDGDEDLVIGNGLGFGGGTVTVLLSDGVGGFSFSADYAVGSFPNSILTGDYDGNGIEDTLIVCSGLVPGPAGGVYALLNDGTGTFTVNGSAFGYYTNAEQGDFNGDGALDLVVHENNDIACFFFYRVLLGDGVGGFSIPAVGDIGCGPFRFAVADYDASGTVDFALTGLGDEVSVFSGNGIGGFAPPQAFPFGPGVGPLVTSDFDGNGSPDIAVVVDDQVELLLGGALPPTPVFVRGDVGGDGSVQIDDPIAILSFLFIPMTPAPDCPDAADIDDDGVLVIGDAVLLLSYLFVTGSATPAPPFPDCGIDVADDGLSSCSYDASVCP